MVAFTKPTTLSKVWATAGVKETPTDSKIQQGWVVELPPYQYDNWLENRQDSFIAHVNQMGISAWDSATEYQGGKSYTQGSNGIVYKALQTNTNVDPINPLNSLYWVRAFEEYGAVQVVSDALASHLLDYSTLANITNVNAARANLSVFSKTESDVRYAYKAGDAAQTFSVANATADSHAINRGQVLSLLNQATETQSGIAEIADQSEMNIGTDDSRIVTPKKGKATYLMRANNLSDLTNLAQARINLGLGDIATGSSNDYLTKAGNLFGIADVVSARLNLGLGSMAVEPVGNWLSKAGNLAGLSNLVTARANLGLGNSSTLNIGTTGGTVAAGDDFRIVNAVPNGRVIQVANGLVGGGNLTNTVTIGLGDPGTISAYTGNSAYPGGHTHSLDISAFFGNRSLAATGHYELPGGLVFQWGETGAIGVDQSATIFFPRAFNVACFQVIACGTEVPNSETGSSISTRNLTTTSCVISNNHRPTTTVRWFAIGV